MRWMGIARVREDHSVTRVTALYANGMVKAWPA